jgi:hypothetical protein
MKFTDDDLKTVEKELAHIEEPETEFVSYTAVFVSALLVRLEAAEELADARGSLLACTQEDFDTSDGDGYAIQGLVKEKEEALRKAAGK